MFLYQLLFTSLAHNYAYTNISRHFHGISFDQMPHSYNTIKHLMTSSQQDARPDDNANRCVAMAPCWHCMHGCGILMLTPWGPQCSRPAFISAAGTYTALEVFFWLLAVYLQSMSYETLVQHMFLSVGLISRLFRPGKADFFAHRFFISVIFPYLWFQLLSTCGRL